MRIHRLCSLHPQSIKLTEVCATHTVAISGSGIRHLISENILLLSGPGCPVCVTSNRKIDCSIDMSREKDVIIAVYGDIMRVPGSSSSSAQEKTNGGDVRIAYSAIKVNLSEIERRSSQDVDG